MDDEQLIAVHRSKPGAAALFAAFGEQAPNEGRTTVDEAIEFAGISRRHAIDLLRSLAEAGCGEFKIGRKGHPSRLEWTVDVVELATWLEGDPGADDASSPSSGESASAPTQASLALMASESANPGAGRGDEASTTEFVEHVYMLRPKMRLRVSLPEDLSPAEAGVLADWVRNLSFER